MKIYGFDAQSLSIVERGECDLAGALKKFEDCYVRSLTEYQSGEEAVSATSFGLYRSELDFIEISCNGKESILVHSDRLYYPSAVAKLFSRKKHLGIKGGREAGVRTVNDYFELDRQAFEQAYSRFLCR